MDSNIKQWHKSVLFACVALLALGGTALAQPDDYASGADYVLNVFQVAEDGFLDGIGLWDVDEGAFNVWIYDSLNFDLVANTFGTYSRNIIGGTTVPGEEYVKLLFGSKLSLTAGQTYCVRVQGYGAPSHGVSFDAPVPEETSYYLSGTNWYDLHDTQTGLTFGGGSPAAANFVIDLLTSSLPNIAATGIGSDWSIDAQGFTAPKTLDMDLTANEMKPFVTEIEVSSDMSSITLTEDVLNDIAERDWIGYGFQLGFWDDENDRFVSSTAGDGLYFGYSTNTEFGPISFLSEDHIRFDNGLVEPGESAAFQLLINLPGGLDSYTFALRQYAVPEPSSFLLLAMSGVMMLLCGRRRR